MTKLERPTKLSEVLQFCPDNDLDLHLRAIKKVFKDAKILCVEKEPKPLRRKNNKREPVQIGLF
jgi:hypothetical protein